jgi:hypothetical protein
MRYSIGIDIGKSGAIIIHDLEDNTIDKFVMPTIGKELDVHGIHSILKCFEGEDCMVAFEDVRAIFGSSAGATFTFGFVAGCTEALVISLGLPYRKVNPKVWQKQAFAGVPELRKPSKINKLGKEVRGGIDTKAMALIASKRLFPNFDARPTERSKNAHDGIVDALLISWWICQNYK